jgi:hypothetical protein
MLSLNFLERLLHVLPDIGKHFWVTGFHEGSTVILTKKWLGYICTFWAIFSYSHLVTLRLKQLNHPALQMDK